MGEFPEINVRSSHYTIARTRATCGNCGMLATLVALAVPPGHELLDSAADTPDAGVPGWQAAAHSAFLFHIDYLPDAVVARLGLSARSFRCAPRDADDAIGWANHCERCGLRLEDQDLFCEPEAAFFPASESSARAIHLMRVDEPFQAEAGGYFPDPEFFAAMSRD